MSQRSTIKYAIRTLLFHKQPHIQFTWNWERTDDKQTWDLIIWRSEEDPVADSVKKLKNPVAD